MSERPSLEKSMSLASIFILVLIIVIVVTVLLFSRKLPGNVRNSSGATSTPPSSTSTPSSSAPASGGSGWQIPSWLGPLFVTIAGLWLIVRVLALKGAPDNLEAVLAVTIALAGAMLLKDGKRFAGFFLSGLIIVLVLFPGIMIWLQEIRQSQINPPAPVEQVDPPSEEAPPSTERMVWAGRKKILDGDGEYFVPKGKKSLCITALGMKDGSTLVPQDITIGEISYSTLGSQCKDLPDDLEGKVIVDFSPGKPWGTKEAILNIYKEYDLKPGGIGQFPFIAIGM